MPAFAAARPQEAVGQWILSLPIPLRPLLAAQPKRVTPALQFVHRAITRPCSIRPGWTRNTLTAARSR